MRHAAISMALVTAEGVFLEVNAALCRMLGRDEATLRQLMLRDITHPDDLAESLHLVGEILSGSREPFQREKRYVHADGHLIWGQVSVSCLRRSAECLFIVQIVDISEARRQRLALAEQEQQVRLLAENAADVVSRLDQALHTDPLTGLASRAAILSRINAALTRRDRQGVTAVLSIGIDRLSAVNHALTHQAGDRLLASVAERLVQALEQPELAARGTGDTFIVLLDPLETAEQAGAIAERLRLAVKGTITYGGQAIEPSVSIGVAIAPPAPEESPTSQVAPAFPAMEGVTADELLRDATLAMRKATSQGRDRFAFSDPHLAVSARKRLVLQEELRGALENGELESWFMPMVTLSGGQLHGYEALVRWRRPDGALEQPDAFLPIARSAGLAREIDLQVLGRSIAALAQLPAGLCVSANLSADTLSQGGLVEQVGKWLTQAGVSPQRLHLEITETALLNLEPRVTATIQELAELGVRWVVDDFGTGFSSISHLRDLPIHGLKLDRSFSEGLRHGDQKSVRLAQALGGLAEGLGLETVAEGIEAAEEAASLRDLGWRCGQGYHFGRAAPLSHWQSSPPPEGRHLPGAARPGPAIGAATLQAPASRSSWALAVTDNVPVGLFALRLPPAGPPELQFVSRRWLEMVQLEREQVMGDPTLLLSRLDPRDRRGLIRLWRRHAHLDQPLSWEGRLQGDGENSWVLVEASPLQQADGSRIWQGVMSDITARKRQELHLRRLLDEAPIAIAIQELREDDPRITFVNQQFVRSLGYDLTTIPHLSDWARLAYPDPGQRERVFQAWDNSLARARQSDGVIEPLEARITTGDGRERDALFSAVLLGDEMVISVLDITSLRQTERELAAARASLADSALAITAAIPVGTYTMVQPPDGGLASFSFMSDRFLQICGLEREAAAADPLQAFACVHPDDYDAWVQLNVETFERKKPFYGECRVVAEGEVRWISAESVPRDLPDGSTVWEGVLIDITAQKEALLQLEKERTLLNTVLTHIDASVYMKDRQGRYLYANASTEQLLGGQDGVIGRTDAELLPPDTARMIQEVDEQVFEQGGPLLREERLPQADGSDRIFLSRKLLFHQRGQEDCLIGFSTEITTLRRTLADLEASEEHFRLLAENSSDVVFRLAEDGRVLWVSPSLTHALGWRPEEWIGQPGTRFLLHRGEAKHYQLNRQMLHQGRETTVARDQVLARDGSIHWIETHAGPYRNAQGEIDGIVASFRVIDEEMAAEQRLRISEQRYRLLAENARDVIWTMEPDGSISYVSPSIQQLRGYTPEEAIAQPLEQIHPPDSLRRSRAFFQQLHEDIAAGRPPQTFRGELEYTCKDGSTIWTEVNALPLFDRDGRFERLLGVSRDISERKRFERQLMAANQQLEQLATTDGLTGIWNRRHLETVIQASIERSSRYGEPLSLILCDIDEFKSINDRCGHPVGDQVLIEFCRRIGPTLRRSDGFGRWGGEEFVILLPHSDLKAAAALAEQLRQRVAAAPFPGAGAVTASFGVAQRQAGESEEAWFQRVDQHLYAAKAAGRNRVVVA